MEAAIGIGNRECKIAPPQRKNKKRIWWWAQEHYLLCQNHWCYKCINTSTWFMHSGLRRGFALIFSCLPLAWETGRARLVPPPKKKYFFFNFYNCFKIFKGDGHLGSISAHSNFYKTSRIHPKLSITHENLNVKWYHRVVSVPCNAFIKGLSRSSLRKHRWGCQVVEKYIPIIKNY